MPQLPLVCLIPWSRMAGLAVIFGWLALCLGCRSAEPPGAPPGASQAPLQPTPTLTPLQAELVHEPVGFVVAMAFAPDGELYYAQQDGQLYRQQLAPSGRAAGKPQRLLKIQVAQGTESGLLGLALSPHFEADSAIYVYYTVPDTQGMPKMGRITRYTIDNQQALQEEVIVSDLPARPDQFYHFGGGLSFGPDGKLYLILGDTNLPEAASDPAQLAGSILRYNPDGSIPADNPFDGSPVYAYGIRNGFGLAWNNRHGLLYETENGTQCDDELNLIEAGADYGWGAHPYDLCPYPDEPGTAPLFQWSQVIAPAGILYYDGEIMPELRGDLVVCGHNEMKLWHLSLSDDGRSLERAVKLNIPGLDFACRAALVQGPGGWIYTSVDERIYRIGRQMPN